MSRDMIPATSSTEATSTQCNIVLVEPDPATRQLYARAISRVWQVQDVASIHEARACMLHNAPVAVILELYGATRGEQTDLSAVWHFLRESTEDRNVPVMVCSVIDERRRAYALGAARYLLKPVSPQQLMMELQQLIGSAEQTCADRETVAHQETVASQEKDKEGIT